MTSTFRPLFGVVEMLWMPFLALILSILPLSRMDLLSAGRKMVASSTPLMMALEKTYQVNRGA